MQINVTTFVAVIVFIGTIAVGVYAKANDDAIERAEAANEKTALNVEKNTTAIGELTVLFSTTALLVQQQGDLIKQAAADARTNGDALIRIEAQTKRP